MLRGIFSFLCIVDKEIDSGKKNFISWSIQQSINFLSFIHSELFSCLFALPPWPVSFPLSYLAHECFLEVSPSLCCLGSVCLSADVTSQACLLLLLLVVLVLGSERTCTNPYLPLLRPLMYIVSQNGCTTMPRNCLSITFCWALWN